MFTKEEMNDIEDYCEEKGTVFSDLVRVAVLEEICK